MEAYRDDSKKLQSFTVLSYEDDTLCEHRQTESHQQQSGGWKLSKGVMERKQHNYRSAKMTSQRFYWISLPVRRNVYLLTFSWWLRTVLLLQLYITLLRERSVSREPRNMLPPLHAENTSRNTSARCVSIYNKVSMLVLNIWNRLVT